MIGLAEANLAASQTVGKWIVKGPDGKAYAADPSEVVLTERDDGTASFSSDSMQAVTASFVLIPWRPVLA